MTRESEDYQYQYPQYYHIPHTIPHSRAWNINHMIHRIDRDNLVYRYMILIPLVVLLVVVVGAAVDTVSC